MAKAEITIDLDKKCTRCGAKGATPRGICLKCVSKGIKAGEFDDIIKPIKDRVKQGLKREFEI